MQMYKEASNGLSRPDSKALALSCFREIWQEYYLWEPEYCARKLSGLSVTQPSRPRDVASVVIEDADDGYPPNTGREKPDNTSALKLYRLTDDACDFSTVALQTDVLLDPPEAYPVYESCTPVTQNILHGDDPNYMPFLPHADDSGFNHEDHALEYKGLAWQENYRDSDTLEITLETARRLHSRYRLPVSEIDETEVLPLALQTRAVWGGIWTGKQRDMIAWPDSSASSCSALPDVSPAPEGNLCARLQDYLNLWCPTADCLQAHCFSHNVEQVNLACGAPFFHSEVLFRSLAVTSECGAECVKAIGRTDVLWTSHQLEDLKTLCHVATTATPCDLAVLCRKPCHEAAADATEDTRCQKERLQLGSETAPDFVPNDPCSHPGPCGPEVDCPCFLNKAHCSRNCRCTPRCPRRWQGCKCALAATKINGKPFKVKRTHACAGNQCPCWAAKRECDPEVCVSCQVHAADACRNMQIQRGLHKLSEVKKGKFGLGCFLAEEAKEGDLITEYIGELIYEPTFLCRGQVAAHVGRSYVFGLNKLMSVDATTSGNSARFINHAPCHKANVAVSILLVNGHQRIGIFAKKDIAAGSEVFMDYGPEYPIDEA
ncbi:SET domain-containing protein [Pilatotrama ljubarskyi]|nr:SET domain-containing protein [Pilatotrama ljubarskyi]